MKDKKYKMPVFVVDWWQKQVDGVSAKDMSMCTF